MSSAEPGTPVNTSAGAVVSRGVKSVTGVSTAGTSVAAAGSTSAEIRQMSSKRTMDFCFILISYDVAEG